MRTFAAAFAALLLLSCAPSERPEAAAVTVVAETDLGGTWQGLARDGKGWSMRVILTFERAPGGGWTAVFTGPDLAANAVLVTHVELKGSTVHLDVIPNWIAFEGEVPNDSSIVGTMTMWGEPLALELKRNNPEFAVFSDPGRSVDVAKAPADRGDGWETAAPASAGVASAPLGAMDRAMTDGAYPTANAVLVARHGRLVYERYAYGGAADELHTIQSATKSVVSLLVGAAIDRGLIADDTVPFWTLFPDRSETRWVRDRYAIPLSNVLSMTAGIAWRSHTPIGPENDDYNMNVAADVTGFILDRPVAEPPGRTFLYNSGLSVLLGEAVRRASGMETDRFAETALFEPLSITRYKWLKTPDGAAHGGGGLYLRARDMLKIGQMVLDGGTWQGRPVISQDWIARSTAPHAPENGQLLQYRTRWKERFGLPDATYGYGYQWWLFPLDTGVGTTRAIVAWGNAEQLLVILPEYDAVILMLSSDLSNSATRRFERIQKYIIPAMIAGSGEAGGENR